MPVDATVARLVEEALDAGRTPEEVCADTPHLLESVRAQWERCQRVADMLDDLLPPPPRTGGPRSSAAPARSRGRRGLDGSTHGDRLPDVPGYALEFVLGRGGMGVVYRAMDLRLRRRVALKMILSGQYASHQERARFLREARAVAVLRHPHVVQVYDAGEHDDRAYYTMELVEGGTLAAKLGGAPLAPADAAALIEPLADAIHAAHEAGIIHRDLKPANVLLDRGGTPKVADFGLARRTDDAEETITLSGPSPGTPSYMAPEQVTGGRGTVGREADVYGLGAVLYEMLTGRPPFRGDSAAETARQVVSDEPAPPSRLNGRVPRDLETICLKCLHKLPSRRYPSAAAVAEDVRRYRAGEPITARRVGRSERAAKWVRRKPAVATAIAAVLVLMVFTAGCAGWLASQRGVAARAAAEDIEEAAALHREGKWDRAAAALAQAESRLDSLGGGGPDWVRDRLTAARRDQALVARIEAAFVAARPLLSDAADSARSAREMEAAISEFGLGTIGDDPALVASRIRESNVKAAIVSALDHWSTYERDQKRFVWLATVSRAADPDPTGWRDAVRQLHPRADPSHLARLAEQAVPAEQSVPVLLRLSSFMRDLGLDPLPFLTRVVSAHPNDSSANLALGRALGDADRVAEALEYLRAAASLQPRIVPTQLYLASALDAAGRTEEAIDGLRLKAAADPSQWIYPEAIGRLLLRAGRPADALVELEAAIRIAPPDKGTAVFARGAALSALGRDEEALAEYRRAVAIEPTLVEAKPWLREALIRRGQIDAVRDAWRADIAADPSDHRVWDGYAEFCLYLGDSEEYRRVYRLLLDKFARSFDPSERERTGRACLLLPATPPDDLRRATVLIDRAMAAPIPSQRGYRRYYILAKALADLRAGRYEPALAAVEDNGPASTALQPMPKLVAALAHHHLGRPAEARSALRDAALGLDWSPAYATTREIWLCHILRREAERLIVPELDAFLDGNYWPKSVDERVALTAICQERSRPAAEARLWAEAFAEDERVATAHRATAARAAALAGFGLGADATGLDPDARAQWRTKALRWASEELTSIDAARRARPRTTGIGDAATTRLASFLSVLRDPAHLEALSPTERAETQQLLDRLNASAPTTRPAAPLERTRQGPL